MITKEVIGEVVPADMGSREPNTGMRYGLMHVPDFSKEWRGLAGNEAKLRQGRLGHVSLDADVCSRTQPPSFVRGSTGVWRLSHVKVQTALLASSRVLANTIAARSQGVAEAGVK